MAKRYAPMLEGLEARQALAISPSLAGTAAAAPDPGQAASVLQVKWASFVFQQIASAVASASAASSSARLAARDAPPPSTATPADDGPDASPVSIAGSSSLRATAPSRDDSDNSSGPN